MIHAQIWLEQIIPAVTLDGEEALRDLNTPTRAYDLMKGTNGQSSLWQVIQQIDYPIKMAIDAASQCLAKNWIDFKLSPGANVARFKMGDFLVAIELVSAAQLSEGLQRQQGKDKRIGEMLQEMGILNADQFRFALRMQTLFRLSVH